MLRANNGVHYCPMFVFVCLHITPPHYHHYTDRSEDIELLKCFLDTFCLECVPKCKLSQLSFMQYMGLCVFSLPITLMMIVIIWILYFIINIKSEVRPIYHCLGLGHETMVYTVYLYIFWHPCLRDHLSSRNDFRLVVIYDMNTIGNGDFEDKHTQEEADTILPHKVLASVAGDSVRELYIWSLDTKYSLTVASSCLLGQTWASHKSEFSDWKRFEGEGDWCGRKVRVIGCNKCEGWSDCTTLRALSVVEGLSGS